MSGLAWGGQGKGWSWDRAGSTRRGVGDRALRWIGSACWRWRSQLTPFYVATALIAATALLHWRCPRQAPLAILAGAVVTGLLAWKRASRDAERLYVLAVGIALTIWGLVAWQEGPTLPMLELLALGLVPASIPWWIHTRHGRSGIEIADDELPGPVRLVRRLWRTVSIKTRFEDIAASAELAGMEVLRLRPSKLGLNATLKLRAGQTVEDVAKRIGRLESALGTPRNAVQLSPDPKRADRCHLTVVTSDPLVNQISWPGEGMTSIRDKARLGLYQSGTVVCVNLRAQHGLVAGMPGSGKSVLLNVLMANLASCRDAVIWGIDLKGGIELAPWGSVIDWLATTIRDAREMLSAATRVIDQRARALADRRKRKWEPSAASPALVIVIDELSQLDDVCLGFATSVASLGRAVEVQLWVAIQRPSASALDMNTDLRSHLAQGPRIVHRVRDARDTDIALGEGWAAQGWRADRLNPELPGLFLILAPGHDLPRPARSYFLADEEVERLAEQYGSSRPSLDRLSRDAVEGAALTVLAGGRWALPATSELASAMPAPDPKGDVRQELLSLLEGAGPHGLTTSELIEATGRARSTVHTHLGVLKAEGLAAKLTSRGRGRSTRWAAVIEGGGAHARTVTSEESEGGTNE